MLNLFDLDDLLNTAVIEKMGLKLVGFLVYFSDVNIRYIISNKKLMDLKSKMHTKTLITDCPWRKCESSRLGLLAERGCAVVDS